MCDSDLLLPLYQSVGCDRSCKLSEIQRSEISLEFPCFIMRAKRVHEDMLGLRYYYCLMLPIQPFWLSNTTPPAHPTTLRALDLADSCSQ